MKTFLFALALFLGLGCSPPAKPPAPAAPCKECAKEAPGPRVLSWSLLLSGKAGEGRGSAVLLKTRGRAVKALTAKHCVDDQPAGGKEWGLRVEDHGKRIRRARVERHSIRQDVSLLEIEARDDLHGSLLLGYDEEAPVPGEDCWWAGWGDRLEWNLAKGTVIGQRDDGLLIHGPAWYGHSGSGLFLARHGRLRLAGIVVRAWKNPHDSPRTPTVCVPWTEIRKFLEGRE